MAEPFDGASGELLEIRMKTFYLSAERE